MAKKIQEPLPGAEQHDKNPRIHKQAVIYAECRDEKKTADRAMTEAHDKLLEIMEAEGVETYIFGDVTVKRVNKARVNVRIKGNDDEDSGDEE
jgi:hypothetical protein